MNEYDVRVTRQVLEQMKEKFGMSVVPIQYPIGKENNFNGILWMTIPETSLTHRSRRLQVS